MRIIISLVWLHVTCKAPGSSLPGSPYDSGSFGDKANTESTKEFLFTTRAQGFEK